MLERGGVEQQTLNSNKKSSILIEPMGLVPKFIRNKIFETQVNSVKGKN